MKWILFKKNRLTKEKEVKLVAHSLLEKLKATKDEIFIPEWHKEKGAQEVVSQAIKNILNETLPPSYDRNIFAEKTDLIFHHFYEIAANGEDFAA